MSAQSLLLLMLLFQVKHLLADFVMQSEWIVRTKGQYGRPGGLVHAGLHAVFTAGVLLLSPLSLGMIIVIALAEMAVHYHIDWSKDRLLKRMKTNPTEWRYWVLTGLDQFAHQATYIAILFLVLGFG